MNISAYWRLMRFDKPIGTLLLLWPTLAALWLANQGQPPWTLLIIFVVGIIIMRAAGCVINDIWDRDIDGQVKRTQARPLASGELTLREALICLVILATVALMLALCLNPLSWALACVGALLTVIYPLCKRFFACPQWVLGLTFNWGIIMAFSASINHVPALAWWLYFSTMFWTIAYDTMYAMVDRDDDIKQQLHSSAILFGQYDCMAIGICQLLCFCGFAALLWLYTSHIASTLALIVIAILMLRQQWLIKSRQRHTCFQAFLNNQWIGLVLLIAIIWG